MNPFPRWTFPWERGEDAHRDDARRAVCRGGVGFAEQVPHRPSHAYTHEMLGAVPALSGR